MTGSRSFGKVCFAATVLIAASAVAPAQAEDEVALKLNSQGGRVRVSGEIVDYTGRSLTIRTSPKDAIKTYASSRVLEVRTEYTAAHEKAIGLFAEHKVPDAEAAFQQALKDEPREWVRRDILAWLVRCALARGDHVTAGSRFLMLVQSDPATRHLPLIPLVWTPRPARDDGLSDAHGWITETPEVSRLLGASLLLDDARYVRLAEQTLNELYRKGSSPVRELAYSQLWRIRLRSSDVNDLELERWEAHVNTMPEDFRGGSYFLLGRGYLLREEHEQAAAAFLWVALVYDKDESLAARACLQSGICLQRMSQSEAAQRLFREVTSRFPQSPFAQEAAVLLAEDKSISGAPE